MRYRLPVLITLSVILPLACIAQAQDSPTVEVHGPSAQAPAASIELSVPADAAHDPHTLAPHHGEHAAAPSMSSGALHSMAKELTIPELAVELLSRFAVRFLSGNTAELFSGNEASDNQLKALSDIQSEFLSNNQVSVFSDIQLLSNVQLHITIDNSGNSHQGAVDPRRGPGEEMQRGRQGGQPRARDGESPEERLRRDLQRRRRELENELSAIRRQLEMHEHVGRDVNVIPVDNSPNSRLQREQD